MWFGKKPGLDAESLASKLELHNATNVENLYYHASVLDLLFPTQRGVEVNNKQLLRISKEWKNVAERLSFVSSFFIIIDGFFFCSIT